MFDTIMAVLSGGATGIFGSVLGKLFGFLDAWQAEKKAGNDHKRSMEMHRLQSELRAGELENERAIVEEQGSADLRAAAYTHDRSIAVGYPWVGAGLRLVRPLLTLSLIAIVGGIYTVTNDLGLQAALTDSVIYMCSTAVLWWFGDRAMRPRRL